MAQKHTQKNTKKDSKEAREQREALLSFHEVDDRFLDIFRNHGFVDFPHDKRHVFTEFYRMLLDEQRRHNSTRLHTIREVGIKHFIDCLMIPKITELRFPLLDVGTGAGFPGVPLKIMFPNEQIILAEGVQKRVEFLKTVREKLKLEKLDIVGRKITNEFSYPVQGVITRAFADISDTLVAVQNSLQKGGQIYFMKGPSVGPEIPNAEKRFKSIYKFVKDIPYDLPKTSHKRRLVVFERV